MVKIRDDLPRTPQGEIDVAQWIARQLGKRSEAEKLMIKQATLLCARQFLDKGLNTAATLLTLEPDIETLTAAILFFPRQEGHLDAPEIQKHFGKAVSTLVEGLIQISTQAQPQSQTNTQAQHDNLRKMLLAVVEDVRVVLIKLAERITALRYAHALEEPAQRQLALEAKEIYAPLANRLGIGQIKWELEDFAFRFLEPHAYKQIAKLLAEKRLDREHYVKNVIEQVNQALEVQQIEAEVTGRVKHIYSIWRKMQSKHLDFQDIYDVRAIRILVHGLQDCYGALGIVHTLWQHVPKEFDDYIATPKENGYRSLHTAVIGPEGRALEIQIRTYEMHQEAELGVAAHWLYKEGGKPDIQHQKKLNSLRQILDWTEQASDPGVEHIFEQDQSNALLQEMLEESVYVFTPQGEVKDLPLGATPLDFAYHIHTELGHRCRGAKVNGAIVPLNYQLKSGQQVEILSVSSGAPSRDWLNPSVGYLNTVRARAKVQAWFKRQARDQNLIPGREMLEKEFKRLGLNLGALGKLLPKLGQKTLEDLYAAVGTGEARITHIVNLLQSSLPSPVKEEIPVGEPVRHLARQRSDVSIAGVGNLMCHFGGCCKPLPGDRIIGYITLGRGVTIHRGDCLHILNKPEEAMRLIEVDWGTDPHGVYPVEIRIVAYDRQGLLRDITSILSVEKVNVIGVNTHTNKADNIADLSLTLEISDLSALSNVINKILQLPNVLEAYRLRHDTHKH